MIDRLEGDCAIRTLPICVVILANTQAANLRYALSSVLGRFREVVVVDSGSTDSTVDIALKHGCRVYHHEFQCFSAQFNWALGNCGISQPWVLRLDADEYVTSDLVRDLSRRFEPEGELDFDALYIRRRIVFLGKLIRFGGFGASWQLRLWRRGMGYYENRGIDEHLVLESTKVSKAKGYIVDYDRRGLEVWLRKHLHYARLEIVELQRAANMPNLSVRPTFTIGGRLKRFVKCNIYYLLPRYIRALLYFMYRYVLLGGFLDGMRGFVFHFLHACWYRILVDALLSESPHVEGDGGG